MTGKCPEYAESRWGEKGKPCLFIKRLGQPLLTGALFKWSKKRKRKKETSLIRDTEQKDQLHNQAYVKTQTQTEIYTQTHTYIES